MSQREGSVTIRVRYPEVDSMGVAHHTNHFVWFEVGRTELMRDAGVSYAGIEEEGVFLPVIEARCRYLAPVRYDELIIVHTQIEKLGTVRARFAYRVERQSDGRLLASGSTDHAAVDRRGRPRRIPTSLKRLAE